MSDPLSVWVPRGGEMVPIARAAARAPLRVHTGEDPPSDADRVRVLVSGTPKPEWMDALPALSFVLVPYAGVPPRTANLLRAYPGVRLHNLHHNAAPTAEMALALLFAVAKRVVPIDDQLRRGDWRERYASRPTAWLLAGRRALVFGWGAIGKRVGRALRALDMDVVGVARSARNERDGTRVVAVADLDAELASADVLCLTAPATPQTRGLFDAPRLARLKRGALVVNVARGSLVDEEAFYAALKSGQVAGAGLDVWWQYPREEAARSACPPSQLPLAEMQQVVFSPHRGGHTDATERLRGEALAVLLDQIASGQTPDNAVDLEAGY